MSNVSQRLLFVLVLVLFGLGIQFVWYVRRIHSNTLGLSLEKLSRSIFMATNGSVVASNYQSTPTLHHTQLIYNAASIQPTPTPVLVSQPLLRPSGLVVIILSGHRERRDVIRETWKSTHYHQPHYNVTVKFSLGTLGLNSTEVEELEAEEMEHHDLILLPHLKDTYTNLTRKVLYSLEWVDQHLEYSYLFKCDDDSFALLDRMAHELANMSPDKGLFWGYFVGNAWPKFEGAWAEKNWSACDIYIPYALGGGYVLSANVVHTIAQNADVLSTYNSEDVTMGVWTASFNIERKHDIRFDVGEETRGCSNGFIVTHKKSVKDMHKMNELLLTRNVLCEKQRVLALYTYKWSRKPMHCCSPIRHRRRYRV